MTAHGDGTTSLDRAEHFEMQPGEPGRGMIQQSMARGYNVGQLQEWPLHSFRAAFVFSVWSHCKGKGVERAGSSFQVTFRQVKITAGCLQISMAQQQLNGAQVCAGFEQMRRETVP